MWEPISGIGTFGIKNIALKLVNTSRAEYLKVAVDTRGFTAWQEEMCIWRL